jgi:hypothetical protein
MCNVHMHDRYTFVIPKVWDLDDALDMPLPLKTIFHPRIVDKYVKKNHVKNKQTSLHPNKTTRSSP